MLRAVAYVLALSVALAAGCGGPAPADPPLDAARPDAGSPCTSAADCDDGLLCNGTESCSAGRCIRGTRMTCDDGIACTTDVCSEDLRACRSAAPDLDHDGHRDTNCVDTTGTSLGDDCDDSDADRYPGNAERCDTAAHDEDCQATTHGARDLDGDGFEDALCCNGASCGDDCQDARPSVHPGATEACNHVDDDCNGRIDEGVSSAGFVDADRDGHGDPARPTTACGSAPGFSPDDADCDDTDPSRNQLQLEICDGLDNDCDVTIDEGSVAVDWYPDHDGDGFGARESDGTHACVPPSGYSLLHTDCDDAAAGVSPGSPELCNGRDDDCSGAADFAIATGDLEDDDLDGIADAACGAPLGRDCDDRDAASSPGEAESCDGRDNDCDGITDENVTSVVFYRDADGDGYGATSSPIVACSPRTGYVRLGGDCDDGNPELRPASPEACNGADEDCDGAIDEAEASASCSSAHTLGACVRGVCAVLACEPGYADCSAPSGCETDVRSDALHCGRCDGVCGTFERCASGACTSPPAFDTTGLVAWLDANDPGITAADGAPVTSWPNRAGGAAFVPFDTAPTLQATSGFGVGRSVHFAAGGMRSTSNVFDTRVHTIFAVVFPESVNEEDLVGTDLYVGPAGETLFMFLGSRVVGHHWAGGSALAQPIGPPTLTARNTYVVMQVSDGTTMSVAVDGGALTTVTIPSAAPSSLQPVLVGSRCVGCYPQGEYQGEIGEVLVFQRALDSTERADVFAYLQARWGPRVPPT